MKASQLIRDLANHISFYGDSDIQFVPDLSVFVGKHYEVHPEYDDCKNPTGRVLIDIW